MKKFLLFLFFLLIGLVLFGWIVKHVGWKEIQLAFKHFSVQVGLLILFLTILSALIRSLRWKTILRSQQFNIPFLKVFEYYLSGLSITFFFPMVIFGGEIFRGYDLKEKYSIPWSKSIASVIIDRILEITVYAVTAIFGIIFFIFKTPLAPAKFSLLIFFGTFLFLALMSLFYFKSFKRESIITFLLKRFNLKNSNGAETIIDAEKEIFRYFRPNKEAMWEGFTLSILHELTLFGRAALLIFFLGKEIGVLTTISIVAFSSLAMLVPVPAALGSHEAVQSFIFNSLGLGANTAMAFVFIIRGVELMVALLGAVFFFRFGMQILESVILKRIARLISHKKKDVPR
jgi:uncharacterized protein (TIRG00374 family)